MSELLNLGGEKSALNAALRRTECAGPGWSAVTRHNGLPLYWREGKPASTGALHGSRGALAAKRIFDVSVALCALLFLLPLLLIVAAAIKVSSAGPVFFVQQREGRDGRLFGILKFRTMGSEAGGSGEIAQMLPQDRRVTALGRFLRRTSIDELPQLLNVLRGEMSLVGPRPHAPGMSVDGQPYAQRVQYYHLRHAVRPGITGWAQANGLRGYIRNDRSARARVDHDLAYIQNWSLWLDCRILILTLWRETITGTGE